MTPREIYQQIRRAMHGATLPDGTIAVIEQAINAAVEEDRKTRPHVFVGSLDRWCEVCNEPDRNNRHIFSRESVRASVESEREACALVADEVEKSNHWGQWESAVREVAERIRARSNGGEK